MLPKIIVKESPNALRLILHCKFCFLQKNNTSYCVKSCCDCYLSPMSVCISSLKISWRPFLEIWWTLTFHSLIIKFIFKKINFLVCHEGVHGTCNILRRCDKTSHNPDVAQLAQKNAWTSVCNDLLPRRKKNNLVEKQTLFAKISMQITPFLSVNYRT